MPQRRVRPEVPPSPPSRPKARRGSFVLRAGGLTFALSFLVPSLLGAQQGTVTGEVVDQATGAPLANVQIFIPGAGVGSISSTQGRFNLLGVNPGEVTLRAELLGYAPWEETLTVRAGEPSVVNIRLARRALALDEVVVTGTAGQARRREVGTSIAQVDLANTAEPIASVDGALAARSPGIISLRSTGAAGSGSQIRLRGNVSVAMSNQPLIYIDGVRIRSDGLALNHAVGHHVAFGPKDVIGPLNDINPNDIERVEIVKGPAATALYGTEAAGGVIQIFTKRGAQGRASWTAQIDQGVNWVQPFGPSWEPHLRMDPFLRNAHQQRYTLSVRGGSEAMTYFVSANVDSNEGVLPNDYEQKLLLRSNFGFQPLSDLSVDVNVGITRQLVESTPGGSSPYSIPMNVMNSAPATDRTPERNANYIGSTRVEDLMRLLEYDIETKVNRIVGGITATYSPTPSLSNRITLGLDRLSSDMRNIRPYGYINHPRGAVSGRQWTAEQVTLDYVGTYDLRLNPDFRTSFSWGGQTVANEEADVGGSGDFLPGPGEHVVNSGAVITAQEARARVINAGVFLQSLFDFHDRYFLTVALRVDGNSAFGSGFGLQPYPRATLSHVLSEEAFWPEGWGEVKLRAAYGHAGRAPGAFDAVRTWNPRPWLGSTAFNPGNVGNPDLGPERTVEMEAGFDASLLDNRLSLDFTYYNQQTKDALIAVTQTPSLGFTGAQLENVGELSNKGIEVDLKGIVVQSRQLTWELGLGVYTNKSRVESLGGGPPRGVSGGGWLEEGHPVPAVRFPRLMNPDEIGAPQVENNHIYGPNQPTHTFTVSTGLDLPRGVRVQARGEYQGGHYIYDRAGSEGLKRGRVSALCDPIIPRILAGETQQLTAKDRWMCDLAHAPFLVYPADFFRMRELTAQAPVPFAVPGASSAFVTLSVQNFWSWLNKDFLQMDPEIAGNDGMQSGVTRSIWEQVPPPASFRASFRIVF
jgi:TonB-dependent starch-binding outer membrane protein SusC